MVKRILFIFLQISGINALYKKWSKQRLFIVGYHSMYKGAPDSSLKHVSIDANLFEEQIKYLRDAGHTFVNFSGISNLGTVHKPTIIYFDDGFKDNRSVVMPLLEKYNITATFFIVPDFCDHQTDIYMNWDEVRYLSEHGMEIGSHTMHHMVLSECSNEEAFLELTTSKARLEKELGKSVSAFSYPKGRVNSVIESLVKKAGYQYAITTKYGTNTTRTIKEKPFLLKKVAPRVYESLEDFKVRLYSFNMLYDSRN